MLNGLKLKLYQLSRTPYIKVYRMKGNIFHDKFCFELHEDINITDGDKLKHYKYPKADIKYKEYIDFQLNRE